MRYSRIVKPPVALAGFALAALLLAALMALFAAFPALDLMAARAVYAAEGGSFAARFDESLGLLRDLGYYLPIAVASAATLGWLAIRLAGPCKAPRVGAVLSGRNILFLVLSFGLGPGLVVNGVLKEISHR